jgi:hypothetical protein
MYSVVLKLDIGLILGHKALDKDKKREIIILLLFFPDLPFKSLPDKFKNSLNNIVYYSNMYVYEKKEHDHKKPMLLDYWMKTHIKETISHDNPNPQKTYTKVNNFSKINSNAASKLKK